jgi:hypothetical protein
MGDLCFSETLVMTYKSSRRHNPEKYNPLFHHCENPKPRSHVLTQNLFTKIKTVKILCQQFTGLCIFTQYVSSEMFDYFVFEFEVLSENCVSS